jgi:hypothetical protein
MTLTVICDKENGLKQAALLATSLAASRQIQGWNLSHATAGIDLYLYNARADVVKEKGGYDTYRDDILRGFTALGYKEWKPEPEVEEKKE